MFYLGLGIGLIVGGVVGLLIGVLLFASARKNEKEKNDKKGVNHAKATR